MEPEFDMQMALDETEMFVDAMFSFNVLVFTNNNPDVRVVELMSDVELWQFLETEMPGQPYIQSIIANNDQFTKARVPYFRVVQTGVNDRAANNFKLARFYQKIGLSFMSAKCSKAVIVGLASMDTTSSPISLPSCFTTTSCELSDFLADEIDLACLKPCGPELKTNRSATALLKIAGMAIPYYVPEDVQWKILSFLEEPTAVLIKKAMDVLMTKYDVVLFSMFSQKEPRIPAYLASYYRAASVQTTTDAATRPYLVPTARPITIPVRLPAWSL